MPCDDSSSTIKIFLDKEDRLTDYRLAKISCAREIEGPSRFKEFLLGKGVDLLLTLDFDEMMEELAIPDDDNRFYLFLQWRSLYSALCQYCGLEGGGGRYELATVSISEEGVEIRQNILPPKEMPPIIPCH